MKDTFLKNERGIGHLVIAMAIAILVIAGLGGWLVYTKNKDNGQKNANTEAIREALKDIKCELDDEDLCKFFTSWKVSKYYTATMKVVSGDTTNTTIARVEGDKTHTKINSELPYETIVIGDALYTKDTEKNKWYKQTTDTQTQGFGFLDFNETAVKEAASKIDYKKLGKEACGDLTCFKYQITDRENKDTKQLLWFDDKDYQLYKQEIDSTTSKMIISFSYDKISITEPSPFEELDGGEVYLPGQGVIGSPTVPNINTDELNSLLEQYQQ